MNLDVSCGRGMTELVGDGEGYCSVPLVDLEVFRHLERHMLPVLVDVACYVVTGWSRSAITGPSSDSRLTSSTLTSYLHPLGRVGRWYSVSIFVILLDGQ